MGRIGCVDSKDRIVKSRPSRRILTLINGFVTGACCPECVLRIPKWTVDVKGGCSGRLCTRHRRRGRAESVRPRARTMRMTVVNSGLPVSPSASYKPGFLCYLTRAASTCD
jgi:hypothetical protein